MWLSSLGGEEYVWSKYAWAIVLWDSSTWQILLLILRSFWGQPVRNRRGTLGDHVHLRKAIAYATGSQTLCASWAPGEPIKNAFFRSLPQSFWLSRSETEFAFAFSASSCLMLMPLVQRPQFKNQWSLLFSYLFYAYKRFISSHPCVTLQPGSGSSVIYSAQQHIGPSQPSLHNWGTRSHIDLLAGAASQRPPSTCSLPHGIGDSCQTDLLSLPPQK